MSHAVRLLGGRVAYAGAGAALLTWAPIEPPAPRVALGAAALLGTAMGCAAFLVLARRLPPLGRPAIARAVTIVAPVVALGAAGEEAVWRFGVLRGLEPMLGPTGAFAVSTAGFAAAHVGRTRLRVLPVHVLTGTTFASAYLLTGRLVAAVVAHVVYNVLVVAACAAWLRPGEEEARV
ncbi:MAG: CPBP family intramembrane metalloprotease [Actinobacteria bacterium]|nr:MAG: CPBP family intramembrane metalloprotease [Actinomycetota bacterium]